MQELSQAWYKGVLAQRFMAWGPYHASPGVIGFGPGFGCIWRRGATCLACSRSYHSAGISAGRLYHDAVGYAVHPGGFPGPESKKK